MQPTIAAGSLFRRTAPIATLLASLAVVLMPWLTANAAESVSTPNPPRADVAVSVTLADWSVQPAPLHLPEQTAVTLAFDNVGATSHEIVVPDLHLDVLAAPGKRVSASLSPTAVGVYRWFCAEPTHQATGMQGWLIVGGTVEQHQHAQ